MVKTIAGLLSQGAEEETLYSHVLSQAAMKAEHQTLISTNLLLKSVYNNLCQIVNACKDLESHKDIIRDISITLLQVK